MTGLTAAKAAQPRRIRRVKHKVEEADAEVDDLEAELQRLQAANSDLARRNSILEKYLQLKDTPAAEDEAWWLDTQTREFIYQAFPEKAITFTVCESRPLTLTGTEIAALPKEQYLMLFKMLADGFAAALMACKGNYVQGTPTADRLHRLCFESGALRCIVAISHPSRLFNYHLSASASTTDAQAKEVWRTILNAIQLTAEQRQKMLELRRRFLRRCAAIMQDRQRIAGELQAIFPHGDFNHQSAYQYLQTSRAVDELRKNLCAELCNFIQFQVVLWKNCLNPVQAAVAFCQCSPYKLDLDLVCLVNEIAEEEGAPSVADIIGRPAAGLEVETEDLLAIRVEKLKTCSQIDTCGSLVCA